MKNFQQQDDWFIVYKHKCKEWVGSGYVAQAPKYIAGSIGDEFYIHVRSVDKLYMIRCVDLLEKRAMYNERWHIDRAFLTEVPITEEWREKIVVYEKRR